MAQAGEQKAVHAEECSAANGLIGVESSQSGGGPLNSRPSAETHRPDTVPGSSPGCAERRAQWGDVFFIVAAIAAGIAVASWLSVAGRVRRLEESDQVGTYIQGRAAITRHKDIYEVGTVGSSFQTRINVTNPWDMPLDVQDIRASCNCTTPVLPVRRLEPHQTVGMDVEAAVPATGDRIPIRIDLVCQRGYRLIHVLNVVRLPRITRGSPDVAGIKAGAGTIDLGDVLVGKTMDRQFTLTAHYDLKKPSDVPVGCHIEGDSSAGIISVGPLEKAEPLGDGAVGRVRIPVSVRISGDSGRLFCVAGLVVSLEHADGTQSRHPLTLRWNVEHIVTCEPPRLFVELPRNAGQPSAETLVVEVVARRAFRVMSISPQAKWLTAEVVSSRSDSVEIAATVHANQIEEWASTDLHIMTDIPEQPVVVVPVSVRRRSAEE